MNSYWATALLALTFALGSARGDTLPLCTGIGDGGLGEEQPNCLVPNAGGTFAVTYSYLNDPTFVNTPVTQDVDDYQTTISAILNGTTTVYQQTFDLPFNALSVQNAITIANAMLASDGAASGAPQQTSNSMTLQSSVLSSVPTTPTLDIPTLVGCVFYPPSYGGSVTCDGVPVTWTLTPVDTYGPAAIMIGANKTDQFFVAAGEVDDDLTYNYSYVVNQNAVTTNTYLITQSYEINGTTNSASTPEPGALALIGCALAILALRQRTWRIGGILAAAIGLARGGNLPPCTGTNLAAQEFQSNCIPTNPGGSLVVTASFTDDPTFVNIPVNQTIDDYQTTITGLLNGGTTVYQQTFDLPFSAVSVQNAIAIANAMLASDGASFGSPQLTANSRTLQSSVLSYVQTSQPCDPAVTGTCPGVTITSALSSTTTFGPATILVGAYASDLLTVLAGQEDINVNTNFVYPVDQNAVTTNTYLITQSYVIDGTTNASSTPEPGTVGMIGIGLALCVAVRRCAPRRGRARDSI